MLNWDPGIYIICGTSYTHSGQLHNFCQSNSTVKIDKTVESKPSAIQEDNEQKGIEEIQLISSKYVVQYLNPWELWLRSEDAIAYVTESLYIDSP